MFNSSRVSITLRRCDSRTQKLPGQYNKRDLEKIRNSIERRGEYVGHVERFRERVARKGKIREDRKEERKGEKIQ